MTLSWQCFFCIILCVVPIDVGVLFYLRSDGQYILVGDAVMAVFLFIIMLCDVLIREWTVFST